MTNFVDLSDSNGHTLTFEQMKERARQLEKSELRRHASISIDNRHKCKECFTCACVEVLRENAR